jgi:methyl-accepting chemotaxis protein
MFRAKRQSASSCHSQDDNAIRQALDKVQAVIWFDLKGNVLDANDNFCTTLGYGLDEIKGQHHRKFVESDYANSPEYRAFWEKLGRGEPHTGEFKRIKKDGRIVWFKASYNPVLDDAGNPVKVVKFAIDITDQKNKAADAMGQLQAISASRPLSNSNWMARSCAPIRIFWTQLDTI